MGARDPLLVSPVSTRRDLFRLALGLVLSAACLVYALREIEWPYFFSALQTLSPQWLLGAMLALQIGVVVRATRWWLVGSQVSWRYGLVWRAFTIGHFANQILPLRGGEAVKVVLVRRSTAISYAAILAGLAIDRLGEVVLIFTKAAALWLIWPGALELVQPWSKSGLFVLAGLALTGGALALSRRAWQPHVARIALRMVARGRAVGRELADLAQFIASISVGKVTLVLLCVAAVTAALDAGVVYCLIKACGFDLPLAASLAATLFLAAASALPAGPAGLGVYQIAFILALGLFSLTKTEALTVSIAHQAIVLVMLGLNALASYWWPAAER
jgi:glycosyltransferase 2 family protein